MLCAAPVAAVFPPWSNAAFRLAVLGAGATIVAIPCALMLWMRSPWSTDAAKPVVQPVMFDHRHHVRDDGIDCRYCHSTTETSPSAGMPSTELCMGCHGQIWTESPLLAPVRASFFEKKPIVWSRVHRLPDFVRFDHSSHLQKGVGCSECHGQVDDMPAVRQVAPLTMGWCIDCHRDPTEHLRPRDRVTDMRWRPERPRAELGAAVARDLHVAPSTDCTTCHM